jgi:imidazolonepropionase-like amidohydrolase
VLRGVEWLKEMKLLEKAVFVVGTESFKVVNELKAAGRPVILSGVLMHKETDPKTGKDVETFVPKVFADAGVPFVLQPNGFGFTADGQLWYQAARCVREGVARDVALKAITQWAADAIGMGDVLGAIAPGKWGNIAILSGDPLAQSTVVEKLLIEGKPVYDRANDRRLKELISGEPPPGAQPKVQEATTPPQPPASAEGGESAKPKDER